VDELAAAYLVLNDKEYLPMILRKIIASARRDRGQGVASELLHNHSNKDAHGGTLERTGQADRVRDLRLDQTYNPISVNNVPEIGAGLKKLRVLEQSRRNLVSANDLNAARESAVEGANLKLAAAVAHAGRGLNGASVVEATATSAASEVSQSRQTSIEQTKLKPEPTVAPTASDVGQNAAEATNLKSPEIPVAPIGPRRAEMR
jgi:hypothetical protein